MEEKKYKKGDNQKGQGPSKPKKEKTIEEKEAQRAKQAEKKRLKKEQARLEEEKKKKELEEDKNNMNEDKKDKKEKQQKEEQKEGKKGNKKEKKDKKEDAKKNERNKENKNGENAEKKEEKSEEKKEVKKETDNKDKKKKIQLYGLTSLEERNEEIKLALSKKEENETSIPPTSEIIKYLSKNVKYSKINEDIIISIRNIFLCGSTKQTRNCINLLNSIKLFVDSVEGDIYKLCDEVSSLIRKVNKLIANISEKCSGLFNTCKYLQQIADDILSSYPSDITKEFIKLKIQYFIDQRIKKIDINNKILKDIIQDGDTILLFGKSKIFRKLLLNAKEKKIKFSVIFVDSPKKSQISSEI